MYQSFSRTPLHLPSAATLLPIFHILKNFSLSGFQLCLYVCLSFLPSILLSSKLPNLTSSNLFHLPLLIIYWASNAGLTGLQKGGWIVVVMMITLLCKSFFFLLNTYPKQILYKLRWSQMGNSNAYKTITRKYLNFLNKTKKTYFLGKILL